MYLDRVGLLDEIGLSPGEALVAIQSIDVSVHQSHPITPFTVVASKPPKNLSPLPGEFTQTEGVMITWPASYPRHWFASLQMVKHIISANAHVYILVDNAFWQRAVELYLMQNTVLDLSWVGFLHIRTNSVWTRDYAPFGIRSARGFVFVQGSTLPNVVQPIHNDASVGLEITRHFDRSFYRLPLALEGGNLIADGDGTCLLLDTVLSWNPELHVTRVEQLLTTYLGCTRVVLLPALPGDDTGHIDMIAMYLDETTLLVAQSEPGHIWYDTLEVIADSLSMMPSGNGQNYQVERVKLANPDAASVPFWSYTNSLIVNDTVIVPAFGIERYDREALETFQRLMPESQVVSVGFGTMPVGAVHCSTMQIALNGSAIAQDRTNRFPFLKVTP